MGACAGVTAYGAAYPRGQLFGPTMCRTDSPRKLAITFDDGPNPAITPKLLGLLERYDARATFFVIGKFVRECPELARETAARGHLLGNHTETHPNLFLLGRAKIGEELSRCQGAIGEVMGAAPKYFRPPFGLRNPLLAPAARELKLEVVLWTLLPGDWRAPSDEWLIRRIEPLSDRIYCDLKDTKHPARRTGEILCLHDGYHRHQNGDRKHTVAALEYWLPRWRDLGVEFVTIEEAVNTPAR